MKRLLDYNPLTGETCWFDYQSSDDTMYLTHEQDVSPALETAHAKAVDENLTAKGIKNDMWHYARVPNSIILEMKQKHGVDFFDKNHRRRVFELLNGEYKRFKTTSKTHNVRG